MWPPIPLVFRMQENAPDELRNASAMTQLHSLQRCHVAFY